MPGVDGFHDAAFLHEGRMLIWHHCIGFDRDTLVSDTPAGRAGHLRECRAAAAKAKRDAERSRTAENARRLREINRLRKEAAA
jgi:hypothetical protein